MNVNIKRLLLAAIAVFVFIFLYEFLIHGMLLMPIYQSTPQVWRDFAVMEANMPLSMGVQLASVFWLAFAFSQLYPEGGIKKGLLFGLFFGVFAGILNASWYLVLPVSETLGWSWFVFSFLEVLAAGAILGAIYRR